MKELKEETLLGDSAFEKLLHKVRPDGPFQWKLIFLFMIPLAFTYSIAERNGIILLSTPDHMCHVPGIEQTNFTLEEWHNITIPWSVTPKGEMKQEECLMYDRVSEDNDTSFSFSENVTTSCEDGWDYDNSSWTEIPVSKFDLVCEKSKRVKQLFMAQLSGATIGSLTFSILSDKFGRKLIFYILLIANITFGTALSFSSSFETMWILTFITGLTYIAMYQVPFIMVQELCNQRLRYITTFFILTVFVVATAYDSIMAWLLGDWKIFLYVTHLPSAIFILYWRFVPESPRWLLSKGKMEECEKVMTRIAETNGQKFTEEMRQLLHEAREEEQMKRIPKRRVLRSRVLTKHLFLTAVVLSCAYVIAGGINMNVHMMLGNVLVNYFVLRSFEFPGNIVGYFGASYLGRRLNSVISMTIASVFIILAAFFVSNKWASLILCGLSKTFCKSTIYSIILYLGELFPTTLRASAYGVAQVIAIASILCDPSIIYLGKTNVQVPYFVWFGIGLLGALLATYLPETLDQPLPQTIQEAMLIGKHQPYCSVIHKWNVHKYKAKKMKDQTPLKAVNEEKEQLEESKDLFNNDDD